MEQSSVATMSDVAGVRSTTSGPGASTVVELHGDIDLDVVEPLRGCLVHGVERGADVLVDLTDVTLIDCACLGALVEAARLADLRGHEVFLVSPSPSVRRTLAATGLDTVFALYGSGPGPEDW